MRNNNNIHDDKEEDFYDSINFYLLCLFLGGSQPRMAF
jgi:hypothetical protein